MSTFSKNDLVKLREMATEKVSPEDRALPVIDRQEFKHALGAFTTGVTLATTAAGGEFHGVTANAVMSVSLDPPLVLLSIQAGTRMHAALRLSDNYALSILTSTQEDVARYFADTGQPHGSAGFAQLAYHLGQTGAPLLDGALSHVDCRIVESHVAGDHVLYLGRVVHLEVAPEGEAPLLYFRGHF